MHPRDTKASALTAEQIDNVRIAEGGLAHIGSSTARLYAIKPGYQSLAFVLDQALHQAQTGKGAERHAVDGVPFEEQWMSILADLPFCIGQACKKAIESTRLDPISAERDLLGAIDYLAGEVLRRRKQRSSFDVSDWKGPQVG